jgi:pyridoxal phosphate enzyme (YggS family)
MTVTVAGVAEGLARVRARIEAAGGDPDELTIVAVSKGLPADVVDAGARAGLRDFGENYAAGLAAKVDTMPGLRVRWHFIGTVQRRQVRGIAPHVSLWHGIDRREEGAEIARVTPGARVLVQVNLTAEPQKGGCRPGEARVLVDGLRDDGLDVGGLMTVGPAGDPEGARPAFRALRRLADELGLPERSMGMSGDLEVAVQEGATIVRVGTALFGPRPERSGARR